MASRDGRWYVDCEGVVLDEEPFTLSGEGGP